jgi:hypothetical protein
MTRKVTDIRLARGGALRDASRPDDDGFDLGKELKEALAKGSEIDYEQWRADVDTTFDDSLKDWWAWAESTDRHIRPGLFERD